MRYAAINYMGSSPATSYQQSELICLNVDLVFQYPAQIRKFIVFHEEGHIKLNTDDEIKADKYAFKKFNGTTPNSHRWSILAMSRVLPFSSKEQYKRLISMFITALTEENYENGSSLPYEANYWNQYLRDIDQMSEQEWQAQNTVDPVSGERSIVREPVQPIGEFVSIAREAWTKAKLGMELTGYDLTILDKYPIPEDFEAYEINRQELVGEKAVETLGPLQNITSQQATALEEPTMKIPLWVWIVGAISLFLILKKA